MKDLSWIKTGLFAHRGLHSQDQKIPENSLAAFQRAIDKGYGIELDITLLRDDSIVVFHDKDLSRLCGVSRQLKDLFYRDLEPYRLLNTQEKIPLLKTVLDMVNGKVPLLIELKPHNNHQRLCDEFMTIMDRYQGKWAMHSFHPAIVGWFRKHRPDVIRGQISEAFRNDPDMNKVNKFLMKHLWVNLYSKPDFINYGIHDMPNRYLDRAQKKGTVIIGYAARSQVEFDRVRSWYSNVVFEFFEPIIK